MKVTAINTSPRTNWNTATLVKDALEGAQEAGAEVVYFDLYQQDKFTGCISCFGCKRKPNEGYCVYQDGIYPILQAIKESDAVIIGTPNYLGQPSAGFRALYERIVFQNLTYQIENYNYHKTETPVLFIMTSNMAEEYYQEGSSAEMIQTYQQGLSRGIGPTQVFLSGDTLQVSDYSQYHWTMFQADKKQERHETIFPKQREEVKQLGRELVK